MFRSMVLILELGSCLRCAHGIVTTWFGYIGSGLAAFVGQDNQDKSLIDRFVYYIANRAMALPHDETDYTTNVPSQAQDTAEFHHNPERHHRLEDVPDEQSE